MVRHPASSTLQALRLDRPCPDVFDISSAADRWRFRESLRPPEREHKPTAMLTRHPGPGATGAESVGEVDEPPATPAWTGAVERCRGWRRQQMPDAHGSVFQDGRRRRSGSRTRLRRSRAEHRKRSRGRRIRSRRPRDGGSGVRSSAASSTRVRERFTVPLRMLAAVHIPCAIDDKSGCGYHFGGRSDASLPGRHSQQERGS